jgi:hypothetical protein
VSHAAELVRLLRKWADVLDVPSGDFVNQDLRASADKIERMMAERLCLDRRIHNQRLANRQNWEIVEMRRKWLGSDAARKSVVRYIKRNRELQAEISALKGSHS